MREQGVVSNNIYTVDGFLVARVDKEDTELPYDILLHSLGKEGEMGDHPRVGVVVGEKVVPVSISDNPEELSMDTLPQESVIFEWIGHYYKALRLHWDGIIDDLEVLVAVSKPVS